MADGEYEEGTVGILIDSGYGANTKQPFVSLQIKDAVIQMSPEEARKIAQQLNECAEGALSDAMIFEFITQRLGAAPEAGYGIIMEFREFRRKRDERSHEGDNGCKPAR